MKETQIRYLYPFAEVCNLPKSVEATNKRMKINETKTQLVSLVEAFVINARRK